MTLLHLTDWQEDCLTYRGEVLSGVVAHFCFDWDGLPIDETCIEWPCGCRFSRWRMAIASVRSWFVHRQFNRDCAGVVPDSKEKP